MRKLECQYFDKCKYFDSERCGYGQSCKMLIETKEGYMPVRTMLNGLLEKYVAKEGLEFQVKLIVEEDGKANR